MDFAFFVIPLVAGVLLGYLIREKKSINLSKITLAIILVLIFSLGFSIGSNNELLSAIPKVGLSSLLISVLAILFSVVSVVLIRRKVGIE